MAPRPPERLAPPIATAANRKSWRVNRFSEASSEESVVATAVKILNRR